MYLCDNQKFCVSTSIACGGGYGGGGHGHHSDGHGDGVHGDEHDVDDVCVCTWLYSNIYRKFILEFKF